MGSSIVLSSFRATLICTHKPLAFQFRSQTRTILGLPRYRNFLHYASSSSSFCTSAVSAVETASSSSSSSPAKICAWPEWMTFVDRLQSRGYLVPTTTSSDEKDDLYKDMNVLKNACLSFARDRFDVFNSLSKDDVQAIVEVGCPNINRKVVNSAKRLRACTGVEEADACGVCDLKSSCDRAYVTLQENESGARTVDIVRILLFYVLEQSANSQEVQSAAKEQAHLSAKRLLLELVELSETPLDLGLVMPPVNLPVNKVPKKVATDGVDSTSTKFSTANPRRNVRSSKYIKPGPSERDNDEAEMLKGDWICSKCTFMNFSRNEKCLRCRADGPERVDMINMEMKKGDWNCPECNFMNFANNKKCFRCTGPRPPRELRDGEWECPSCDFLNFRRNFVCKKCQVKRPKEKALQHE